MLGFPSSAPFPRKFPTRFDLTLGLWIAIFSSQVSRLKIQAAGEDPSDFLGGGVVGAWRHDPGYPQQSLTKTRLQRHDHDMTSQSSFLFRPLGAPIWPSESKSCRRKSSKNRSCHPETSGIPRVRKSPREKSPEAMNRWFTKKNHTNWNPENHVRAIYLCFWGGSKCKISRVFWEGNPPEKPAVLYKRT